MGQCYLQSLCMIVYTFTFGYFMYLLDHLLLKRIVFLDLIYTFFQPPEGDIVNRSLQRTRAYVQDCPSW